MSAWTTAHLVAECFLKEQWREGCSKPSPESSAQGRAVSLINVSPLSESQKQRPGLVVCFFYVPCSRLVIKRAIEGTFWFHKMCHHRGVESWVVISGNISYLKSAGHDSPEQPVLICPVSTDSGNCILSLVNQLLLQATIVLADGLCSLESCCSPPGFKSLGWSSASVSSVGFWEDQWRVAIASNLE